MATAAPLSRARAALLACVAALGVMLLPATAGAASDPAAGGPMANARYVGEKRCGECHDTERELFGHTQHAKAFRSNPRDDVERALCEACHGPGSLHVANSNDKSRIIGFSKDWGTPVSVQNAKCLGCHSGGPTRGEALFEPCIGCHRKDASGRTSGAYPRLAGQHASVLIKQMLDFRGGQRDNPKMEPFISDHAGTPHQMADLAA